MSWSDYVTNMTTLGAAQCGIYTKAGATCCQSDGFELTPTEVQSLKQMTDGNTGEGKVEINHQACTMISFSKDDGTVQAKTKVACLSDNKIFYHVEATKDYLVVCGKYGAGERAACSIAHGISEYLKGLGQ